MAGWYRWEGETLILSIRVQPKASSDEIVGPQGDDSIKIRITAPPVDGKANQHLIKFLAKAFGVAKSRVTLIKGETGRDKRLAIDAPSRFPVEAKIESGPSA
jgi:uncharacterized protein (TIGR00251 family)